MPAVFVCYRREDSGQQAGRLFDHLVSHFGADQVFKDVDSIPLGHDFRKVLGERVGQCDVLLALVGDQWLSVTDARGQRRLDDPGDFVRIEIETALRREIPVIPLLVGRAPVPAAETLPPGLKDLAYRHGMPLRPDPDFHHDIGRLVRGIAESAAASRVSEPRQPTPSPPPESTKAPSGHGAAGPPGLGPLVKKYRVSWFYVYPFYFFALLCFVFAVYSVINSPAINSSSRGNDARRVEMEGWRPTNSPAPGKDQATPPPSIAKDEPHEGSPGLAVFLGCLGALLACFGAVHSQVSVSLYQGGFTYQGRLLFWKTLLRRRLFFQGASHSWSEVGSMWVRTASAGFYSERTPFVKFKNGGILYLKAVSKPQEVADHMTALSK